MTEKSQLQNAINYWHDKWEAIESKIASGEASSEWAWSAAIAKEYLEYHIALERRTHVVSYEAMGISGLDYRVVRKMDDGVFEYAEVHLLDGKRTLTLTLDEIAINQAIVRGEWMRMGHAEAK